MPSPTFIIPGASRSGTSTLWSILRSHPEICMPDQKELRFFDKNQNYAKGIQFYEKMFGRCNQKKEIGEASPPYWNKGIIFDNKGDYKYEENNDSLTRIHKHYPDIKVIFTLRNPVDRLYSQFWKNVRQGREHKRSVAEAVKEEINGKRNYINDEFCWVYRNSYATHFRRWKKAYGKERVKVLIFEEWTEEPKESLEEVYNFLGVEVEKAAPTGVRKNKSRVPRSDTLLSIRKRYLGQSLLGKALSKVVRLVNQREGRPTPSKSERAWLFKLFEDEVKEMENMLGRKLDVWYPDSRI